MGATGPRGAPWTVRETSPAGATRRAPTERPAFGLIRCDMEKAPTPPLRINGNPIERGQKKEGPRGGHRGPKRGKVVRPLTSPAGERTQGRPAFFRFYGLSMYFSVCRRASSVRLRVEAAWIVPFITRVATSIPAVYGGAGGWTLSSPYRGCGAGATSVRSRRRWHRRSSLPRALPQWRPSGGRPSCGSRGA